MTVWRSAAVESLILEEFSHWCAQQDFNWHFLVLVFIGRLLPCKLARIQFSDATDDFDARLEWAKCVTICYMNLRTATEFTREFVKRWLKIIFSKENAGQL